MKISTRKESYGDRKMSDKVDELMLEMAKALRLAVFSDDTLIKSDAMAALTKYNNWKLETKLYTQPQPQKEGEGDE